MNVISFFCLILCRCLLTPRQLLSLLLVLSFRPFIYLRELILVFMIFKKYEEVGTILLLNMQKTKTKTKILADTQKKIK